MDTIENTKQHVEGRFSADPVVDLINKLGGSAHASTVYGEAVERDGITVIPVAKVGWGCGFGRGGATGERHGGEGLGGGGGVCAMPVGFIEVKDGSAQFRPIRRPAAAGILAVIGGTIVLSLMVIGKAWGGRNKRP